MRAALIVGARAALVSARVERISLLLLVIIVLLGVLSGILRTIYHRKVIQTYGRIIDIVTKHCRSLGLFNLILANLGMFNLMWWAIGSSITDRRTSARYAHLMQTRMVFIEESGKIQHLPAILARKIVRQRLQFMEHNILYVIIIEDWIQHETIGIVLSTADLTISLVEESLASGHRSKVHCLLCCAIRHHLCQLLHLRTSHETSLVARFLSLLMA